MVTCADFKQLCFNLYNQVEYIPVRGVGSRLYDKSGHEVIDLAGGIAVNALGHAHPELIAALLEQAKQLWHVSNIMPTEPALTFARNLIEHSDFDKVFFCNSGTEAVEAGLKLARAYARLKFGAHKHKVVAFNNSFHGRTLFALTAGGQAKYSQDFTPLVPGVDHGEFNQTQGLSDLITADTAVVVVELIQAEGGVIPATPEFIQALRERTHEVGALLMFDEVQTGIGRTGKLFGYQHYPVTPDLISCAKALGAGFPIGALLATNAAATGFTVGSHGSTFGGNPLACAVANTAFNLINQESLLEGVVTRGNLLRELLAAINHELGIFSTIRGQGLLVGAELAAPYQGRAREIMQLGFKHGVATLMASPNVCRFTPALNIPFTDLKLGIERFTCALHEWLAGAG
jgi:predicted acetylornithine/succinylornithine family transaminase